VIPEALLISDDAWQAVHQEAIQMAQPPTQPRSLKQLARMQQFLESGDPILVAEATAWFYLQFHPARSSEVCQRG